MRIAALLCVVGLVGCGALKDAAKNNPLAFAEFCRQWSEAQDARNAECMGGPKGARFSSAEITSFCAEAAKSLAAKRISYDAAQATTCINAIKTASCDSDREHAYAYDACNKAMGGAVPVDGACYHMGECVKDSMCSATNTTCPGKCIAYPKAGETCGGTTPICNHGLSCVTASGASSATCVAELEAGATCTGGNLANCKQGTYCDNTTTKCTVPANGNCQVVGYGCTPKNYCKPSAPSSSTGTCTVSRKAGETCTQATTGTVSECERFTYCAATGKCTGPGAVGAECGFIVPGELAACADSYCDTIGSTGKGTCKAYKAVGDACTSDNECGAGYCTAAFKCAAACSGA